MPEMPEVETVRRTLTPLAVGKVIKKVDLWYPNIISSDHREFKNKLAGKKILAIDRYAKFLLIRLSEDLTIVSHLRMEGKYYLSLPATPKDKHDHVQFEFTDGTSLRYNDVRKFGRMQLVETGSEKIVTGIAKLGPEADSPEFTLDYFYAGLNKRHKNIKNVLLDQSLVSGLGNIYVDEVLWSSKIHPLSICNKIPKDKVAILRNEINHTIEEAIKYKGTTVHTYLDANGDTGHYQNRLKAYGHAGEKCRRCQSKLEKIKLSGRGTTFCPNCQVMYK